MIQIKLAPTCEYFHISIYYFILYVQIRTQCFNLNSPLNSQNLLNYLIVTFLNATDLPTPLYGHPSKWEKLMTCCRAINIISNKIQLTHAVIKNTQYIVSTSSSTRMNITHIHHTHTYTHTHIYAHIEAFNVTKLYVYISLCSISQRTRSNFSSVAHIRTIHTIYTVQCMNGKRICQVENHLASHEPRQTLSNLHKAGCASFQLLCVWVYCYNVHIHSTVGDGTTVMRRLRERKTTYFVQPMPHSMHAWHRRRVSPTILHPYNDEFLGVARLETR